MASNESDVVRFMNTTALGLVRDAKVLAGADQARLDLAVSGALAPADPMERMNFLGALQERLDIEQVVQHMLSSAFGHVLEHHCLSCFSLNLHARTIISAFEKMKGGKKAINKVAVQIQARFPKAVAGPVTAETVLRCRVIGVDLQTLTLPAEPMKCTSCAFTSKGAAIAAARSLTYAFLKYIRDGNAKKTGKIGSWTVEYSPSKQGYAMVAPVGEVGHDVATGLVGYETPYTFDQILATVKALCDKLKPKQDADYHKLLMLLLEQVTEPVSMANASVRAIFKSDKTPNGFYLFSMYPEP